MKKVKVYTHYDSFNRVIAEIIPKEKDGHLYITKRTYNRILDARTVGGDAGVYTDCEREIWVYSGDDVVTKI